MDLNESNSTSRHITIRPNIVLFLCFLFFGGIIPSITVWLLEGVVHDLVLHMLFVIEICSIPLLLYFLFTRRSPISALSISPLSLKNGLYVTVITLAWMPIVFLLVWGSMLLTDTLPTDIPPFRYIWLGILTGGIVIAIFEELLFRGPMGFWNGFYIVLYTFYISANIISHYRKLIGASSQSNVLCE